MIPITEEELRRLYIENDMTMSEIAESIGVSTGSVFNYIKKYGIPIRTGMRKEKRLMLNERVSVALKGRKRPPFTDEHKKKISESKKGKFRSVTDFGGHRKKRSDGYVYVFCPLHPYASKDGYVMEHILVMEAQLGRYITRDCVVHHKNRIRDDNRIENLELMTFEEHARFHLADRRKNNKLKCHTVRVRNVETREEFDSAKEAGDKYSVNRTNIIRACRHKNRTVRGFHWEYI